MTEPHRHPSRPGAGGEEEFVEFARAGGAAAGEFECVACNYGVVVHGRLPGCPMCGGALWERSLWTPFAQARAVILR